jgi:lipoyl(octanoyl) transferase
MRILRLPEPVSYEQGLALQEDLVRALLEGTGEETLLLLEHLPVYTIGRLRDRSSLGPTLPHPVHETNRGGQATYHGPGQIVGYPILDLTRRGRDLHAHLRLLEDILIEACNHFDVEAGREPGLTGVWVHGRKIASLGVGVRRWTSMHGFAINITNLSLGPFHAITPCGIQDVVMTSLESESPQAVTIDDSMKIIAAIAARRLALPDNMALKSRSVPIT